MTNLKDYLRDLVMEAIEFGEDDQRTQDVNEWVEDKLDQVIETVVARLIGGETS